MDKMTLANRHFVNDTRGANLVEYIILVGVVALIALAGFKLFGTKVTSWQVLPADASDFEESAMRACELVLARDVRIGRVPKSKRSVRRKTTKAAASPKRLRR